MLGRIDFQFDKLFSPDFFARAKAVQFQTPRYPLPNDAKHLYSFFSTSDGKRFKSKMRALVRRLEKWLDANQIDKKKLRTFSNNYIQYSGRNEETNERYLPLYIEGISNLENILLLLESGRFEAARAKDIMAELAGKLDMCAPGVNTYLFDAYSALQGLVNIDHDWMNKRREFAQQAAMEVCRDLHVSQIWEVHYVNAVLNYHADALGIPMIRDEYIVRCNEALLDSVFDGFASKLARILTVENLVASHVAEMQLSRFIGDVAARVPYASAEEKFTAQISRFGAPAGKTFFYVDDLIAQPDLSQPYQASWKAEYVLFASIFNRLSHHKKLIDHDRMQNRGYIDVNCRFGQLEIGYYKERSLKFAQVHVKDSRAKKTYFPFLSWLVERLAETPSRYLLSILKSDYDFLTCETAQEVIRAIARYLASDELKHDDDVEQKRKNLAIMLVVMSGWHPDLISHLAAEHGLCGVLDSLMRIDDVVLDLIALFNVAAEHGRVDFMRMLSARYPKLYSSSDLQAAFVIAAQHNQPAACRYLMAQGVDLAAVDHEGANVLHRAAMANAAAVLPDLLTVGCAAALNASQFNNNTPLHLAIKHRNQAAALVLIDFGATIQAVDLSASDKKACPVLHRRLQQHFNALKVRGIPSSSVRRHTPRPLLDARGVLCDRLEREAVRLDLATYNLAIRVFSDLDHFLCVFANYSAVNPHRQSMVRNYQNLLMQAYSNIKFDATSQEELHVLHSGITRLSQLTKGHHRTHGALAKFGLHTQSRLANQFDKALGVQAEEEQSGHVFMGWM